MYADDIRAYRPQDEQEETDKRIILEYVDRYPDTVLTRQNEYAHITSSGFVVNADATKVLMAHHNIYKVWAWTGGHADGDPDLLGVALREAEEETGAAGLRPLSPLPLSLEVLTVPAHQKRGREVSAHLHLNFSFLLLAPREGQALREKPDENSGVAWLPAHRLEEYCTEPEMLPIYRRLIQRAQARQAGQPCP